jgi:hypothetical protein
LPKNSTPSVYGILEFVGVGEWAQGGAEGRDTGHNLSFIVIGRGQIGAFLLQIGLDFDDAIWLL